jgi:hypothetical protein
MTRMEREARNEGTRIEGIEDETLRWIIKGENGGTSTTTGQSTEVLLHKGRYRSDWTLQSTESQ